MSDLGIVMLDNIFWHALSGAHAQFASGSGAVRRYARGFSPIAAFADPRRPDLAALAALCEPGEKLYCDGWSGSPSGRWSVDAETTMFRMVWDGDAPADDSDVGAVKLGPEHARQALELAELTRPGPFGIRTIELGDYFGYFEGDRLVAMAGERLSAPGLREISGVCTHPDFQGRGLARRLMAMLIRRHRQHGRQSFLHVMHDNVSAHQLYLRMGFHDYLESVVRVISHPG